MSLMGKCKAALRARQEIDGAEVDGSSHERL